MSNARCTSSRISRADWKRFSGTLAKARCTIFRKSGGIDSGLTAAIAADALGAEKVHAIRLPSPFTSVDSMEDAEQLAAALHLRMDTVPITPLIDTARQTLAPMLEMSAEDARVLALADQMGDISLALRGVQVETVGMSGNRRNNGVGQSSGAVRVHAFGTVSGGGR